MLISAVGMSTSQLRLVSGFGTVCPMAGRRATAVWKLARLDKTEFDSRPSVGGWAAKNVASLSYLSGQASNVWQQPVGSEVNYLQDHLAQPLDSHLQQA